MSKCVKCQSEFHCVMADGETGQPCWCFSLPFIPAAALSDAGGDSAACFCPACLQEIADKSRPSSI